MISFRHTLTRRPCHCPCWSRPLLYPTERLERILMLYRDNPCREADDNMERRSLKRSRMFSVLADNQAGGSQCNAGESGVLDRLINYCAFVSRVIRCLRVFWGQDRFVPATACSQGRAVILSNSLFLAHHPCGFQLIWSRIMLLRFCRRTQRISDKAYLRTY